MKIDQQHMLPAHIPFYKRRLFWGVVLLGVFILPYTYVIYQYLGHPQLTLFLSMLHVFIPLSLFNYLLPFEYIAYTTTLILYVVLIYFSLFREKINFYMFGLLFILMIGSFFATIEFIENFV